MLSVEFVVETHDEIILEFGGLPGFAGGGIDALGAALQRVVNHAFYAGLDDALGIAALYAEAIARGHLFNDGNKRTALSCALTYLERQQLVVVKDRDLEDLTVLLATGELSRDGFARFLSEALDAGKAFD